jgi:hypothetical protein
VRAKEPRVYYPSAIHPDYAPSYTKELAIYALYHCSQGKKRKPSTYAQKRDLVRGYIEKILHGWQGSPDGQAYFPNSREFLLKKLGSAPLLSEEGARSAIDAVKKFGPNALHLDRLQVGYLRDLNLASTLSALFRVLAQDPPWQRGSITHYDEAGNITGHSESERIKFQVLGSEQVEAICNARLEALPQGASWLVRALCERLLKPAKALGGFAESYYDSRTGFIDELKEIHEYLRALDELATLVGEVTRLWQFEIKFGNKKVRRIATRRLKKLLNALIPETRGKRAGKAVAQPVMVKYFYYSELFRFYHVRAILSGQVKFTPRGSVPGQQAFIETGRRSGRVKYVSENFAMPVPVIREFWCLDGEDIPQARPITVHEMARIVTARHFGITQHAVSNIIAS